jgi:hypothetical protein
VHTRSHNILVCARWGVRTRVHICADKHTNTQHNKNKTSFDRNTGRPRGFGFVCFSDPSVVDKVVAQGKHHIDRREVRCGGVRGRSKRGGVSGGVNGGVHVAASGGAEQQ